MDITFLFKKYEKLIVSLMDHQVFRDYLGHKTIKIPRGVLPIPNGYVCKIKKNVFELNVTTSNIYEEKMRKALESLDLVSSFLYDIKESQKVLLGQLGLISSKEYLPFLLRFPRFASYTGSPQTGGGGGNVTTCKNNYASTADSDWTVNRNATTGTVEVGSTNTVYLSASGTTNKWSLLIRNYHSYDLAVMGTGATVSAGPTIGLYVTGKTETLGSQSYNIYGSTVANANDVVAADYDNFTTTAQATALTGAGITTSAVNNWTLNAAGVTTLEAAAGSAVKFSVMLVSDNTNAEPTWGSAQVARIGFHMAADATPPLLTATYTPVPSIVSNTSYSFFL